MHPEGTQAARQKSAGATDPRFHPNQAEGTQYGVFTFQSQMTRLAPPLTIEAKRVTIAR